MPREGSVGPQDFTFKVLTGHIPLFTQVKGRDHTSLVSMFRKSCSLLAGRNSTKGRVDRVGESGAYRKAVCPTASSCPLHPHFCSPQGTHPGRILPRVLGGPRPSVKTINLRLNVIFPYATIIHRYVSGAELLSARTRTNKQTQSQDQDQAVSSGREALQPFP